MLKAVIQQENRRTKRATGQSGGDRTLLAHQHHRAGHRTREHQGLIAGEWGTSENNRRAKYYRLTAAGRKRLGEETASWNSLVDAIARALAATPAEA